MIMSIHEMTQISNNESNIITRSVNIWENTMEELNELQK